MTNLNAEVSVFKCSADISAGYASGYDFAVTDLNQQELPKDTEFLDALCNGVVVIGKDFKIISQNYISRINMGNMKGKYCYKALENREVPCERCPMITPIAGEYETSMRCAGKTMSIYEAHIYPAGSDGNVIEVYPDMINRETLRKNMYMYREELDLLNSVVEDVRIAMIDASKPQEN